MLVLYYVWLHSYECKLKVLLCIVGQLLHANVEVSRSKDLFKPLQILTYNVSYAVK